MKKFVADMHMHTLVSGHAYGTIDEMMRAAAAQGLELIGISEHGPGIPGTVDPFYYCNLKVIPREMYGVKLVHGCEINVLNDGTLSLDQKWIDRLDYAIAGIHDLCYTNAGKEKNTENLISCMKNEKIFFVSHPDDDRMPLDYEEVVKAAVKYHVALEVNNSSLRWPERRPGCKENYREMLRFCQIYGAPIIVDTDAHHPIDVGKFTYARELLKDYRFDEELILNTSGEKVLEFIGVNI